MNYRLYPNRFVRHVLSMPFIYWMIMPSIFLDLSIEIYHRIGFKLYGLPYVERGKYIRIDRHKLEYLNTVQKINCMYCGYVNGLFAYAVEIAGETEKYWCGIQHARMKGMHIPEHHEGFAEYGNEEEYQNKYPEAKA